MFTSSKSLYNDKLRIWPDHVIDSPNHIISTDVTINYTQCTWPWTIITVAK